MLQSCLKVNSREYLRFCSFPCDFKSQCLWLKKFFFFTGEVFWWIFSWNKNSASLITALLVHHIPQEVWPLKKKVLLLLLSLFSHVRLCATPLTVAHQAPPSLGLSRQEHWSGLPFPSPMHDSEKWKWNRSAVSNSLQPHGLQPSSKMFLHVFCPFLDWWYFLWYLIFF